MIYLLLEIKFIRYLNSVKVKKNLKMASFNAMHLFISDFYGFKNVELVKDLVCRPFDVFVEISKIRRSSNFGFSLGIERAVAEAYGIWRAPSSSSWGFCGVVDTCAKEGQCSWGAEPVRLLYIALVSGFCLREL